MYLRSVTLALLCSLLSLSVSNAEVLPRHIDLVPRQTPTMTASSSTSSVMAAQSGVAGGEGGSSGGTGSTGSNGGGGVDGAAASIGGAGATSPTSTTSASAGLAGARATGDARLWAAGVGAGLIGVVGGMI